MPMIEIHAVLSVDLDKLDFAEAHGDLDVTVDMIKYLMERDWEDYDLLVQVRDYYTEDDGYVDVN